MSVLLKRQRTSDSPPTRTRSHALCDYCKDLFSDWEELEEDAEHGFPHFPDLFALQASASQGCPLCRQFLQHLIRSGKEALLRGAAVEEFNQGRTDRSSGRVRVIPFSRVISRKQKIFDKCRFLIYGFNVPSYTQFKCRVDVIPALDSGKKLSIPLVTNFCLIELHQNRTRKCRQLSQMVLIHSG